jgi:hypothetical protein
MHVIARLRITLDAVRSGPGRVPVASLAIMGVLAASAGPAHPAALTHRAPQPVRQPTCFRNPASQGRELDGAAAASSSGAWAVGYHWTNSGASQTVAERWNGTAWRQVPSPNPGGLRAGDLLFGVAAPSPGSAWAVGTYFPGRAERTLIEHWNGTAWTQTPSPSPARDPELGGVTALPSGRAWAVGDYIKGGRSLTLAEHWNGTVWAQTPSQTPPGGDGSTLYGVAASSPTSAWAVGTDSLGIAPGAGSRTLIERWTGTGWTRVASPNPDASGYNDLSGVAALSATDAWAVGHYDHHTTGQPMGQPLIEHWNGTGWTVTAGPRLAAGVNTGLAGVAVVSPADAWAVGSYCAGAQGLRTLTEHWNGTAWTRVASPNPGRADATWLSGVTATSATNAWAVGFYANHISGYHPVIEHWNGTAWTIVPAR